MTRSSISGQDDGNRDASLTEEVRDEVVRRLQRSLEMDGDAPIDLAPIHEAAADAPPLSEKKIARARRYADSLAEPQRTMFAQYLDGMTAAQIAESMSLKPKAVAKSLAKAYVSLNAILNHMSNGGD